MRHPLVVAALFVAFLALTGLIARFTYKLGPNRVDLEPGQDPVLGAGLFWPTRVFSSASYTAEGRRRLPRLWFLLVTQVLIFLSFAALVLSCAK